MTMVFSVLFFLAAFVDVRMGLKFQENITLVALETYMAERGSKKTHIDEAQNILNDEETKQMMEYFGKS